MHGGKLRNTKDSRRRVTNCKREKRWQHPHGAPMIDHESAQEKLAGLVGVWGLKRKSWEEEEGVEKHS